MAGHQIDQDHLAAERLDDLAADHLLARIVAALDQHRRLDARDQLLAACPRRTPPPDRPPRAPPAPRRAPAPAAPAGPAPLSRVTEASPLRPTTSRSQAARAPASNLHVAGMQQIEAAIGEADAQALPPPVGEMLVEHRPVEHDLFFRRERGRRQNARAQFGDREPSRCRACRPPPRRRHWRRAWRIRNRRRIASMAASTATTVSPAPETSRTRTG